MSQCWISIFKLLETALKNPKFKIYKLNIRFKQEKKDGVNDNIIKGDIYSHLG